MAFSSQKIKICLAFLVSLALISCTSLELRGNTMEKEFLGSVERISDEKLEIISFSDPKNQSSTMDIMIVEKNDVNFLSYIDMVGGSLNSGEKKYIPVSNGRISMLENGDLHVNMMPSPKSGAGMIEIIDKNDPRYEIYMKRYPGLTPGRFRLIL